MVSRLSSLFCCLVLCAAENLAVADDAGTAEPTYVAYSAADTAVIGVGTAKVPMGYTSKDPLLDRTQRWVFQSVWRAAMRIDRVFGAEIDESAYQEASGSLAPALLWDEFDGFQPKLRFNVNLPLPHLDERFHAFIGRVNRDEYVTERNLESGAFPRQYGPVEDDQTLLGLRFRSPKAGAHFDADAGVRLNFPVDPFVKGSYRFFHGSSENVLFSFRETAFWQNSEGVGVTSRVDIEKIFDYSWLARFTASGTISQESEGVRGYTALSLVHGMPNRRAIAAELFTSGEMDADVPLGNYGMKLAYRKSISRDWLIMEIRTSLTWPKDEAWQVREATWGVGIGFEMFFGTDDFLARPVTF
ncbi:MAG: hypothetical protein WDO72_05535 [Pseudomonadota bacterium]